MTWILAGFGFHLGKFLFGIVMLFGFVLMFFTILLLVGSIGKFYYYIRRIFE